jgi:hypothetical protein
MQIDGDVAAMRQMSAYDLEIRFIELFSEPPRSRHREHLIRRIAWRLQSQQEGDLTERARQRAAELAQEAGLRLSAKRKRKPKTPVRHRATRAARDVQLPMPGTILLRQYAGRTLQVLVREQGFEYDGQVYTSLTALTKRITGSHQNGRRFFGLSRKEETFHE